MGKVIEEATVKSSILNKAVGIPSTFLPIMIVPNEPTRLYTCCMVLLMTIPAGYSLVRSTGMPIKP